MADETQPAAPAYLTVGKLKEQLAAIADDDSIVVIDAGKANCLPVLLPIASITGRELPEQRFRLGGGRVPLVVIRAGS